MFYFSKKKKLKKKEKKVKGPALSLSLGCHRAWRVWAPAALTPPPACPGT